MSDTVCPRCCVRVLDTDSGIQCDQPCKRWFHVSCLGMPKSEYQRYCTNANLPWNCRRSDCLPLDAQPLNILVSKVSLLLDNMQEIKSKVDGLLEVPSKLDKMQSDLSTISTKLSSLESRMSTAEDRLNHFEARVEAVEQKGPATSSTPEETIAEINDRGRRASNLMVYKLQESSSASADARMENDIAELKKLWKLFVPDQNPEIKCHRVGRLQKGGIRPLKIIFPSAEYPKMFLSKFNKDDLSEKSPDFANITVSRDRTDRERQYLNKLRSELERRTKDGETNLTIKYMNGIPSIVKSIQKN